MPDVAEPVLAPADAGDEARVVETRSLPPDPSLISALGLHHSLPTALADLVDNSVDAGAGNVLIRFVQDGTRIVGLEVVDDGKGMDDATIDLAMTYAHTRDYSDTDLGHFGLGLKAASLSQARVLTVWSKAAGSPAVGRMLDGDNITDDYRVAVLDDDQVQRRFAAVAPRFPLATGTVVEWRGIHTFLMSSDADEQTSWLERTVDEVRSHLGIVAHRLIADGRIRITLDVFDVRAGRPGALRTVVAVDPFGYGRSGDQRYPRALDIPLGSPRAVAHLWPARSAAPEFRLGGAPGRDLQGLYFYRRDRLLQIGGWNGLVHARPDFGLARIAIDLEGEFARHVRINPEKSGLTLDATAAAALEQAILVDGGRDGAEADAAGAGLRGYLDDAVALVRASRVGQHRPVTVVEPSEGLPEDVLDAYADAVEFSAGADPVGIRWRSLARDRVFEVDLDSRTLWLNARHRTVLVGHRSLDPIDAPMLKTLFHLLVSDLFEGVRLSARDHERMGAWQGVLLAAVTAEESAQADRRTGER